MLIWSIRECNILNSLYSDYVYIMYIGAQKEGGKTGHLPLTRTSNITLKNFLLLIYFIEILILVYKFINFDKIDKEKNNALVM